MDKFSCFSLIASTIVIIVLALAGMMSTVPVP